MEKQDNKSQSFIITESQPSLGLLGISWEALKIIVRNRRPLLSLLLLVFLSLSFLELGSFLILSPVFRDLSFKKELWDKFALSHTYDVSILRDIQKDTGLVLVLGLLILPLYYITFLFFSVGIIFSSSEAYTAKLLSLKDTFLNARRKWTRPIIISFYMTMVSLSYLTLFFLAKRVISSMDLILYKFHLNFAVVILFGVCYIYVAALWMMSIVVSVLEGDSSGLKTIDRALNLMKLGNIRRRAYVIKLLTIVASAAVLTLYSSMTTDLEQVALARFAIRIPAVWLMCVVKLFMFVMYTVLYHEAKKNCIVAAVGGQFVGTYVPMVLDQV